MPSPVATLFAVAVLGLELTQQRTAAQATNFCDFGTSTSPNKCGYTDSSSLLKWTPGSSCTRTADTGPCTDNTGNSIGVYMFIESSYRSNGTRAKITSPLIASRGTSTRGCLQFYYHMYGEDIGVLNAYLNDRIVWTRTGQQGNLWLRADLDLDLQDTAPAGFSISFESVIINNKGLLVDLKGDVAIDDVLIATNEVCWNNSEALPSTMYATTQSASAVSTTAATATPTLCTFEDGWCGFYNRRGASAWATTSGSSLISGSGPSSDKTYNNSTGKFVLFTAPSLDVEIDRGTLSSPRLRDGESCMTFNYYVSGSDTGLFNIYADVDGLDILQWTTAGSERFQWLFASVPLPNDTVTLSLEGVRGSGENFTIAVDDLSISSTACPRAPSYACDFGTILSTDSCGYTDGSSQLKWARGSSCTLTSGTGPCSDHTGNRLGVFRYIESSYKDNGTKAVLVSPAYRKSLVAPGGCLQFYYHMYGEDIGTLSVYLNDSSIWRLTGGVSNLWLRANVELNIAAIDEVVFRIRFEGSVLNNKGPLADLKGDIAIDDILVTTAGPCEQSSETVPPTVLTSTPATSMWTDIPISNSGKCDFQSGMCGFQNKRDTSHWTLGNGLTVPGGSPSVDSTYGNSTGMFVYFSGRLRSNDGGSTILESPRLENVSCLSFKYFSLGSDRWLFNVYADVNAIDVSLWSSQDIPQNQWVSARIDVPPASEALSFEAVAVNGSDYIIAVDDIYLNKTTCYEHDLSTSSSSFSSIAASSILTATGLTSNGSTSGTPNTSPTGTTTHHGNAEGGTEATPDGNSPEHGDIGLIVGVIVGVVALAALIAAFFLMKKGKCKFGTRKQPTSVIYSRGNKRNDRAELVRY